MNPLPDKPSEILAIALTHLQECKEKGMIIDMSRWAIIKNGKPCQVCLAGAVIVSRYDWKNLLAKHWKIGSIGEVMPAMLQKLPHAEREKLRMLNDLVGEEKIEYHDDPELFMKNMWQTVETLKAQNK